METPNELDASENLSRLPWRVVAGWAWKKMHPLMQAARHRLFTPATPASASARISPIREIDLESHIQDMLNVIQYEDFARHGADRPQLGGMVATGVADRARDRVAQLIYIDAFVPRDGQSLFDLNESGRRHLQEAAKDGDGWRVPPMQTPPDTLPEDVEWLSARRVHMPIKCFETKLKLQNGEPTLPRSTSTPPASRPRITVWTVCEGAPRTKPGLALLRDRRQPCAERHRAGGADGVDREDHRVNANGGGSGALRRTPHFSTRRIFLRKCFCSNKTRSLFEKRVRVKISASL